MSACLGPVAVLVVTLVLIGDAWWPAGSRCSRDPGPHPARRAAGPGRAHQGRGRPPGTGSGAREHDPLDVGALPATAHVRPAHPSRRGGATLLRRGRDHVDGSGGLDEHLRRTGSGVWAVPPGVSEDGWLAQPLFEG